MTNTARLSPKTMQALQRIFRGSIFLQLVLMCARPVSLQSATFLKVLDTSTLIPGGTGTFRRLDTPVYHAGRIAFMATGTNQAGIYLVENGRLSVVADRNTPAPNTIDRFRDFRRPTVDKNTVSFVATTGTGAGIRTALYQSRGGTVSLIADQNTSIPAGRGNYTFFHAPFSRDGRTLFVGGGPGTDPSKPEVGLYLHEGGELRRIVNADDLVPGKTVQFINFSREEAAFDFDGQQAVFLGSYGDIASQRGVLCSATITGQLRAIADSPDYTFDYVSSRPRLDRDAVIFNATYTPSMGRALTQFRNGELSQWIAEGESLPGIGPLLLYGRVDLAWRARRLLFSGRAGETNGLYKIDDKQGEGIVKVGVPFDNKMTADSSTELFDGRGFDGRHIAFRVHYSDLSNAIFLADLGPPPGEVAIEHAVFAAEGFRLELAQNVVTSCTIEFTDQISSNVSWRVLQKILNPGPAFEFVDPSASTTGRRFYRAIPE